MQIKIKYFAEDMPRLTFIGGKDQSNWIDLYTAEEVVVKEGDFVKIPLGIAMELPEGYEAIVAPRSGTFGKYGVIQANSIGVIDSSFRGPENQWMFPAKALMDATIPQHTRICQFRIQKIQPNIEFVEDSLENNADRGSFGSTGV